MQTKVGLIKKKNFILNFNTRIINCISIQSRIYSEYTRIIYILINAKLYYDV